MCCVVWCCFVLKYFFCVDCEIDVVLFMFGFGFVLCCVFCVVLFCVVLYCVVLLLNSVRVIGFV